MFRGDKRHDDVKRTIETLGSNVVVVQPPLVDEPGKDAMGRLRVTQVYRFTREQGNRRRSSAFGIVTDRTHPPKQT